MNQPTEEQIKIIKSLLSSCIDQLIEDDSDIINMDTDIEMAQLSPDAKQLNRELHETTINHRLAYYIERNLEGTELDIYNVDIEYNRYYKNQKILGTPSGELLVRPDIIVHSRMDAEITPQHYLVIEAKKAAITQDDMNKIIGFIMDERYLYLFGLTISYCINDENVRADLYYYNGQAIMTEAVDRPKN